MPIRYPAAAGRNANFPIPLLSCMDRTLLEKMVTIFRGDHPLTEEKSILLMKAVPDRMHTILSGLTIALVLSGHFHAGRIAYSDTGVREGYIYSEIGPEYGLL